MNPEKASPHARVLCLLLLSALAACQQVPVREPACAPCPKCPIAEPTRPPAAAKPLQAAQWADLPGWQADQVGAAWPAFLLSCRALATRATAWKRVCAEAQALAAQDNTAVRAFFETNFTPYAATQPDGKTEGLITGYYEPLLKGSRTPGKHGKFPVYGVPDDLLTIDLGEVLPELKHMRLRGRLSGNKVIPYHARRDIEENTAPRLGTPLLWVEDQIELFFLQIQGSGRVKLPDGSLVRLGYADQNGHPYQSIGRVLIERGELALSEASMQGIQAWARANPGKVQEVLNLNPSYVFFRELPSSDDGPLGALGVPLTAERSLAIDPRHIPLGAPVFLATTQPNSSRALNRLMLAQDTGGAIKGVVRADLFWGFGAKAGEQAGRMKQPGQMWVLLPKEMTP
ncbi:MAG: Membrane-bound lytic murein transglycosylase A precursor [Betaproteobacteria bacterium ADurb.Bin341]|nr:MAG: Membrane-bound lytic murein transglycosylase A precursor [Betaproteobacteria bacterium ADurb.Bin341]